MLPKGCGPSSAAFASSSAENGESKFEMPRFPKESMPGRSQSADRADLYARPLTRSLRERCERLIRETEKRALPSRARFMLFTRFTKSTNQGGICVPRERERALYNGRHFLRMGMLMGTTGPRTLARVCVASTAGRLTSLAAASRPLSFYVPIA